MEKRTTKEKLQCVKLYFVGNSTTQVRTKVLINIIFLLFLIMIRSFVLTKYNLISSQSLIT